MTRSCARGRGCASHLLLLLAACAAASAPALAADVLAAAAPDVSRENWPLQSTPADPAPRPVWSAPKPPPVVLESYAAFRADAESDSQGVDGWFYCTRVAGTQEWVPLDLSSSKRSGSKEAPVLTFNQQGLSGAAVGAYLLHPGVNGDESIEVAKVWRSLVSGTVTVTGEVVKSTTSGDGVQFIFAADERVVQSATFHQKGENISFSETVTV